MEKSKLIYLKPEHYVIADNSEIKVGDWYYRENTLESLFMECKAITGDKREFINGYSRSNCKKITHSTQPLEKFTCDEGILRIGWKNIKPLSLSEVEELIYGYSVEKIAKNYLKSKGLKDTSIAYTPFVDGFNAHKELVRDKVFTVEDITLAFRAGIEHGLDSKKPNTTEYIQSLLPPTEWDVEITPEGKIVVL